MKYAYIENGKVWEVVARNPYELFGDLYASQFVECGDDVQAGWFVVDGEFLAELPPVPKTPEQIKQEITDAVSVRLDSFAKSRNYDSILSACTYATSSVEQFAKEGQYCVNMRDATWAKLYQIMQEVEAGIRPMPTGYDDIESELPTLVWPL